MTMSREEAMEIIANGIMKPVVECLMSGEFKPAPDDSVAENDKVIGEMDDLEKALYTAAYFLANATAALENDASSENKICVLQMQIESYTNLLWYHVNSRIEAAMNVGGTGIRNGYQIVAIAEGHGCGCGECDVCEMPEEVVVFLAKLSGA